MAQEDRRSDENLYEVQVVDPLLPLKSAISKFVPAIFDGTCGGTVRGTSCTTYGGGCLNWLRCFRKKVSLPIKFPLGTTKNEVFITEELWKRPPKKVDYYREKMALLDLGAKMATQPEKILPSFVDLAMQMAGGSSAGLSLYEAAPAPGVFHWTHMRGKLACFEGATAPRNDSPCGVTLDRDRPILVSHAERAYSWISDIGIVLPEVLLVPLHGHGHIPIGTLWIVSEESGHFDIGTAQAVTDLAAFVDIALAMQRNKEQAQVAFEEQKMLAREMDHRVKNIFMMTQSLVRITAKSAETKEQLTEVLTGRLHALAQAHSLVRRSVTHTSTVPGGADLATLVATLLKPHERAADGISRFVIQGPPIRCGNQAANGIALVLHELATNAAKYGSLTEDEGTVEVVWREEEDRFILSWTERNGPRIDSPPDASGFGSTLSQTMITHQFAGTLSYDWQPSGVVVTVAFPVAKLSF